MKSSYQVLALVLSYPTLIVGAAFLFHELYSRKIVPLFVAAILFSILVIGVVVSIIIYALSKKNKS